MNRFDHTRYRPWRPVTLPDRRWPDNQIEQAPRWCAVDLRDGNQALIDPMSVEQKMQLFQLLVDVGVKEIEVGFPAASQPDFDFVRAIIEQGLIPQDVTIQVLTQAREHLIARTYEALRGVHRAVVHLYNSTSPVQREKVFRMDQDGVVALAVDGARRVREHASKHPDTEWLFQYSPESFSGTEPEFAVRVCDAVMEEWSASAERPVIINLPATVEMSTPNVFADQVEWFCRHLTRREAAIISIHAHNDRGTAVAATELSLLAGADRVEGTLLGNGERTGNLDLVTIAMNLYSQGVDPRLDLSNMGRIVRTVEQVTDIAVHPRHPWAGELVYTAFSGSHQDAIRKCLAVQAADAHWDVAYLPIDPRDIGRSYEEVIRINSQSGKGGVAHVLERDHGISPPRWLQIAFAREVQQAAERRGSELSSSAIWELFQQCYMQANPRWQVQGYQIERDSDDRMRLEIAGPEGQRLIQGRGAGALEAVVHGLEPLLGDKLEIVNYSEQAMSSGSAAEAVSFVQVQLGDSLFTGVASHRDTVVAVIHALLVAVQSRLPQVDQAAA